jgi:signal transduction histidine kinase
MLKIRDNGTSNTNSKSEGTGLTNMKMRAKSIGFNLTIENNEGYTIILEKVIK